MISSIASMGRWWINIKTPADVVEKLAYLAAILLGIGLLVGVVSILGVMGIVTMLGAFVVLIALKWGWLWLLK